MKGRRRSSSVFVRPYILIRLAVAMVWFTILQVDVLPIERFNAVWRPSEPERLQPVYVQRVTIREALRGDLWGNFFGSVQLVEPTFGVRPLGPVSQITLLDLSQR